MAKNRATVIVNLPFDGFYESLYSAAIDHEEERHIEDCCNESDHDTDETNYPEAIRLDASTLSDFHIRATDYSAAYRQLAADYVVAFDYLAGQALGFDIADTRKRYDYETKDFKTESYRRQSMHATFESMDSPREYNFATDRVYATVPTAIMYLMWRKSRAEGHATLKEALKERFTSRDGFHSHYSNDLDNWSSDVATWDHNELGTLLIAALRISGFDPEASDERYALFDATCGDEGAYQAWSEAVDWQKLETLKLEARAEKLSDWLSEDEDSALIWRANHRDTFDAIVASDPGLFADCDFVANAPYRCPETPDLFA